MVQTTVLDPLDRIINSSYFVDDPDQNVRHYLKQVCDYRKNISEAVKPSIKSEKNAEL